MARRDMATDRSRNRAVFVGGGSVDASTALDGWRAVEEAHVAFEVIGKSCNVEQFSPPGLPEYRHHRRQTPQPALMMQGFANICHGFHAALGGSFRLDGTGRMCGGMAPSSN